MDVVGGDEGRTGRCVVGSCIRRDASVLTDGRPVIHHNIARLFGVSRLHPTC